MITMSATTIPMMIITPLVSPPVTGALDVVGVCAHADHDSAATIMKARTPHTHVNPNASDHLMTRSSLHPDRPGELDDVISPSCAARADACPPSAPAKSSRSRQRLPQRSKLVEGWIALHLLTSTTRPSHS